MKHVNLQAFQLQHANMQQDCHVAVTGIVLQEGTSTMTL
jgi:hypothetical protein